MPFISASVISPYNSIRGGAEGGLVPLLLDLYPNAAAAYSLRKLRTAYTDSAIRVRRSSDNTEQDIGFVGNELDTTSLLSFVGAGDGFVTIRYDQSGNGNDLTNISAVNQPKIVLSGQIITENQKPMIDYDGANHYLKTSSGLNFGTSSRSLFLVQKTDVVGFALGRFSISTSVATGSSWGVTPEIYVRASGRVWAGQVSTPTISTSLISNIYTSGDLVAGNSMWLDGSSITQSGSTDGSINTSNDPMIEGARGENTFLFDGKVGDTIIYKSDQSSNRAGIENNINSYYNMYWDGSQTGLLDDYPNASAAYSLRALNSAYTGAAIKVRRSSDNAEQDINLLYDGTLNTASLLAFVGAGDGFVTTWYDQSGGGNDVAQVSDSAQPQIVSSGVVVTTSDNYAIDFSGSTKNLVNETFDNSTQVSSVFTVAKSTSSVPQVIIDGVNLASRQVPGYYAGAPSVFAIYKGVTIKSAVPINTNINLLSTFFDVNSDLYLNGDKILDSVNAGNHTREGFTLGSGIGLAAPFEGSIFEVIVFDEQNKSSDRAAIETNINNHYTIY